MKASVRWLRELCPQLPDDPNALAARLTAAGIAVDAVVPFGLAAEACVVARVVSTRPHPSRSGLRLVTVDNGAGQQEVVCGAPNVPDPGGLVVLAPLGAHLPAKGVTIEKRSIAGVPSEGMICSEAELGLGDEAGGILVLTGVDVAPGTPLARAVPASRDAVLEIDLTPNRPDALGHVGLAREAAALFGVPFAPADPPPPENTRDESLASFVSVAIEDAERCAHYGAAVLLDATVAPSPLDVRWRLASLGVRSISNVVDVTNLVMLELGHPMHAFDLDKVHAAKIVVRCATEGEKLRTLDGVDRVLTTDDLVVCDGAGPVALGGVMGGGDSEISDATARVLLECAWFEPRGVRRVARRHGLHTESSHRFERGVDWGDTAGALARASAMIARLAGALPVREARVFEARAMARRTVPLRHERVQAVLGVGVGPDDARTILGRLGFTERPQQGGVDAFEVPSFRPDVTREVDLVEEVGRVGGYDAIPTSLPAVRPSRDEAPTQGFARRAREAAVSLGLSEAITYAFVSPRDLEAVGAPPARVTLRNPLGEHQSVMRTSLLPGLLRALGHARRHGERDVRLFTVGTIFTGAEGGPAEEKSAFAAVFAGDRASWLAKPEPATVWDGKGLVQGLVARLLRREATIKLARGGERPAHLHPRGAAWVEVDGKRVGRLGPIHPEVVDSLDLGDGALVVELDLAALAEIGPREPYFTALPRFPAATRDLAVVVRDEVPAGDVEHAVREAAGDLAENVRLFDRFVGGAVPGGHASLAVHVVYRAADRTLTDAEVDTRHAHVVAEVEKRFGAQLRA
jgi:phenylalanyl-tRNA synthetase beta chain